MLESRRTPAELPDSVSRGLPCCLGSITHRLVGGPLDHSPFVSRVERRHRRSLRYRILAVLALSLPVVAHAACKLRTAELPVQISGTRAVATVGINGTQVPLTVDSGAFFSVLTYAAATQLKLPLKRNDAIRVEGITGRVETQLTTVDKLEFMTANLPKVEFIVGGNEPGAGTMGLLGRNILAFTDTEYDLAHGVIRFHFPNDDCDEAGMAYWAGSTPVTELEMVGSRERFPTLRARAKLNGQSVVAMFDTGARTLVSARAARRAGVPESTWKPGGMAYGVGRGRTESWIADFEKFEIDGEIVRNARLRVADFPSDEEDMLLGIDFFLSHRIYVSNRQKRMYVTYNGGPIFSVVTDATAATSAASDGGTTELTTADQYARRGAASAARRDYARALADLDRACALEPNSADYLVKRAEIQAAMRQYDKAMADLEKALTLDPRQVDARFQRAAVRLANNDIDGARSDLDTLDRQLAPQADLRARMAVAYMNAGLSAKAIDQIDLWLAAHPKEAWREEALNNRCWARVLLGIDLQKALDDCDEAVDADPKSAARLDSRGWVHLGLGRLPKALADFDRSLAIDPKSASSLYGRGLVRQRMGEREKGDADVAAAVAMEPGIVGKMGAAVR